MLRSPPRVVAIIGAITGYRAFETLRHLVAVSLADVPQGVAQARLVTTWEKAVSEELGVVLVILYSYCKSRRAGEEGIVFGLLEENRMV